MTQSQINQTPSLNLTPKSNLQEGPITAHLIRLTLPMVWGIGVIISFQLVDMYFIAKIGKEALSAISFTFPITYAIFAITMGFSIATSSVVSRLIGEKKYDLVCRITTQGLLLVFVFTSIISVLGLIFQNVIFQMMGADESLLPLISKYMILWFLSVPILSIPLVGNAAMRAGGDAVTPALIMTLAAVSNLILDPLLIFGWGIIPAMGIEGAALATVIANFIAMIGGLYALGVSKKMLKRKWLFDLSDFKDTCQRLLVIALPVGITGLILPITNAVIIALLAGMSVEAVIAFGIASRIEAFAFIVLMALSTAMASVIGQNWGAGNQQRVMETLRKAIGFSLIWSLIVSLILIIIGKQIAGLFSSDPKVLQMAQILFWIIPISYALSNLLNGWMSAFNAMGKPKLSFIMMLIKYIIMLLPALWIGHFYGIIGVFSAIALVNIMAGLLFHVFSWKICNKK